LTISACLAALSCANAEPVVNDSVNMATPKNLQKLMVILLR
jgi:hypothetical protein